MNLIHEGGSNDITLYINGDLSSDLLNRAIEVALRDPNIWNLYCHILPKEFYPQFSLFAGWFRAGHIGGNPPVIRLKKAIRRSSDGGASERTLAVGFSKDVSKDVSEENS
jgi:hypothetical protein